MNAELPDTDHDIELSRSYWQARAFNRGADSRLRGDPAAANPYESGDLRGQWAAGWRDVERHWGEASRRPAPPLPDVRDVFAGMEDPS